MVTLTELGIGDRNDSCAQQNLTVQATPVYSQTTMFEFHFQSAHWIDILLCKQSRRFIDWQGREIVQFEVLTIDKKRTNRGRI